jgi:predicted nucleotidyltransferase
MDPVLSLKNALERLPQVRLAVLFGSRATGRAGAASDVDLGLSLRPLPDSERRVLEVTLARACPVPLDVIDLDTAPPQLRFEIARAGRVLVENEPDAWVAFKRDAMIDWWDWAPYARRMHEAAIRRLREEAARGSA